MRAHVRACARVCASGCAAWHPQFRYDADESRLLGNLVDEADLVATAATADAKAPGPGRGAGGGAVTNSELGSEAEEFLRCLEEEEEAGKREEEERKGRVTEEQYPPRGTNVSQDEAPLIVSHGEEKASAPPPQRAAQVLASLPSLASLACLPELDLSRHHSQVNVSTTAVGDTKQSVERAFLLSVPAPMPRFSGGNGGGSRSSSSSSSSGGSSSDDGSREGSSLGASASASAPPRFLCAINR